MIIDKEIEIKIHPSNFKWFKDKGYYPFKKDDTILIKIEDIMPNSKILVSCICSECSSIKKIAYQNYRVQFNRGGYYVCFSCSKLKSAKTNIEKYGSTSPLCNIDIINKSKKTMVKKYGVDNISKLDRIKEDRCDNFRNDNFKEKSKITWIEKYGVDNPSKSNLIKDKKRETTFKNYGVDNPTQSKEIFDKSQRSGKKIKEHKCGLEYRGTYECDFLDFCISEKLNVEKGPTIRYKHNNKNRYYHSDFFLTDFNLICEIKSTYYLEKFKEVNLLKMKFSEENFDFIFIVDKNYENLIKKIENYK